MKKKREARGSGANGFFNQVDVVVAKQQKKAYEQHPQLQTVKKFFEAVLMVVKDKVLVSVGDIESA